MSDSTRWCLLTFSPRSTNGAFTMDAMSARMMHTGVVVSGLAMALLAALSVISIAGMASASDVVVTPSGTPSVAPSAPTTTPEGGQGGGAVTPEVPAVPAVPEQPLLEDE